MDSAMTESSSDTRRSRSQGENGLTGDGSETVMGARSLKRLLDALRREWTKNDGKPSGEWAPGRDLKETALVIALVICTALMALIVVAQAVL